LIREVLKNFKNCPIEIRFTPELPIVTLIGDKKIASIMICRSNNAKEIEALLTNSPAIVELARDYFEKLWSSGEKYIESKVASTSGNQKTEVLASARKIQPR